MFAQDNEPGRWERLFEVFLGALMASAATALGQVVVEEVRESRRRRQEEKDRTEKLRSDLMGKTPAHSDYVSQCEHPDCVAMKAEPGYVFTNHGHARPRGLQDR